MLMTVLLLAGSVQSLAQGTQAAETGEPEVKISGVRVTEDGTETGTETGYLEVSVHVSAADFQTVGVVLSYDMSVLTPVDWGTGAEVPVNGTLWTTVVPSKGADNFSGKPALARLAEERAPEPEPTDPEAPAAEEDAGTGESGRGYLYLGAESLVYQDVAETRLVTVRFKIAEAGSGYADVTYPAEGEALTDNSKTLCLAPETVAEAAAPGAQVFLTVGEPAETLGEELNPDGVEVYQLKYYAWRTTVEKYEENNETPCTVSFGVEKGAGIGASSSEPIGGGGNAITFFDWDGRAIDAVSAEPETAAAVVAAWEKSHAARLENKPGYEFDCWLVVEEKNDGNGLVTSNGTFTSNDTRLGTGNPDVADLSHLFTEEKKSVFLQAAYYAKTTGNGFSEDLVNGGKTDNTDRYYTISDPVYTRYGAADAVAGSYSLTMTVTRLQEDGETGVTRLREPAIWVAMTPAAGGANIMNLIRLENTDETTFEIVTTKQIGTVTYKVIDVYGVSNWPGCADRSDVTKGSRNRNTCITLGTQGYLAEQAYNVYQGGNWEATVNNWAFADCYYNNGSTAGKANATWWTEARCNTAKSRLLAATTTKGAKLTYAEVLTAVGGVS
jgi:hypothetical protein